MKEREIERERESGRERKREWERERGRERERERESGREGERESTLTEGHVYKDLYLAHQLKPRIPFDILVNLVSLGYLIL